MPHLNTMLRLSERLFILTVIFYIFVLCDSNKSKERKGRHLFMLLGYLHGYKIGQDFALKYPSYLVSPVIILPSVNQQQSVNFQNGVNDENYQENGGSIQTITSAKLVSNNTSEKGDDIEIRIGEIAEINAQDQKNSIKQVQIENTTHKQNMTDENNTTTIGIDMEESTIINNTTEQMETTTRSNGPYEKPFYDNEKINSLTITTTPNEHLALPAIADNRWQYFTLRKDPSDSVDGNMTLIDDLQNNTSSPLSTEIVTEYPVGTTVTFSNGPYPNALYNNGLIDQLSITTNSYTNEASPLPSQEDRWNSYYSLKNKVLFPQFDGFKPLSGLYYDGFLHRPLNKYPFIVQNYV